MNILLVWVLAQVALGKLASPVVTLNQQTDWKYLTKFAMDKGSGTWEVRAKLLRPTDQQSFQKIPYTVSIYLDDQWEDTLALENCDEKLDLLRRKIILEVPESGEWSEEARGTLSQSARAHVWYFAVSDCSHQLQEKQRLKFEVKLVNSDGSEFSLEKKGMVYLYPLTMVLFLAVLWENLSKLLRRFNKSEELETNVLIFNIAVTCQFFSIVFEAVHLFVYSYNGQGLVVFDFLYEVFEALSTLIVTVLFILMGSGWTLKYRDFPEEDVYIPVAFVVLVVNLLVVGLSKLTDDAYNRFSELEGVPGVILVIVKLGLWGWFLVLVMELQKRVKGKTLEFLRPFGVLASVYFLSQPLLLVVSSLFVTYWRNTIVVLGNTLVQIVVFFFISHLFSEKSSFYKISTMSKSVLPGKSD